MAPAVRPPGQAKPDDVFPFVGEAELRELWPDVQTYLGKTRDFWNWLMAVRKDQP